MAKQKTRKFKGLVYKKLAEDKERGPLESLKITASGVAMRAEIAKEGNKYVLYARPWGGWRKKR